MLDDGLDKYLRNQDARLLDQTWANVKYLLSFYVCTFIPCSSFLLTVEEYGNIAVDCLADNDEIKSFYSTEITKWNVDCLNTYLQN